LEALAGAKVQSRESVISFGAGAQIGDVTIGTVAGRDVLHIKLDIHQLTQTQTNGVQIGEGMSGGSVVIQKGAQVAGGNIINRGPRPLVLVAGFGLSLTIIGAFAWVVVRLWFPEYLPQPPLPAGAWNIVVAEPGFDKGDGIARPDPQLDWLGERLRTSVGQTVLPINWRSVPTITGSEIEREHQAAAIAERMGASVVVSALMRQSGPDDIAFQPEIFIRPQLSDQSLSVEEIVGAHAFGRPISIVLGVTSDAQDDELNRRLRALQHFLNGTKYYIAERYDEARVQYEAALKAIESPLGYGAARNSDEGNKETLAVIYEFLAATELAAERYDAALAHADEAHSLWETYARPYLTRASTLYVIANKQLRSQGTSAALASLPERPTCFSNQPQTTESLLAQALACYDEGLQVASSQSDQIDMASVDLPEKVSLSKANIYLLLSRFSEQNYWSEVNRLVTPIIERHEVTENADELQRLRRVAAHAYFRRGLSRCIAPGTTRDTCSTAIADYEQAIHLLETPRPGFSCAAQVSLCYPSDQVFIKEYRAELERTRAALR